MVCESELKALLPAESFELLDEENIPGADAGVNVSNIHVVEVFQETVVHEEHSIWLPPVGVVHFHALRNVLLCFNYEAFSWLVIGPLSALVTGMVKHVCEWNHRCTFLPINRDTKDP